MKYLLTLLFSCCVVGAENITNLYVGQQLYIGMALTTAPSSDSLPIPELIAQTFTNGTQPAGWFVDIGSALWDFTPALYGAYSLGIPADNSVCYQCANFPNNGINQPKIHTYVIVSSSSFSSGQIIYTLYTSVTNYPYREIATVALDASKHLRIDCPGIENTNTIFTNTTATYDTAVTNHLWTYYQAATAGNSNGILTVGFSTTNSEPYSGNNFASISNHTCTYNADYPELSNSSGAGTNRFNKFGVSTNDMPNGW